MLIPPIGASHMPHSAIRRRITFAVSTALLALSAAPAAHAATASEVVSGGSLNFISGTPTDVTFPAATLNGLDLVRSQTQAFDVNDSSGSNSGWSITATSTRFTAGTHFLSLTAATILAPPADVCDAASTCTLATNSVSYPYVLPAGVTAPTATKMFNAAAGTGQGSQTITPTWNLALPAGTWAGGAGTPYTATWTFTLVSGP
ncbi:MAG: WxL domain-containing protein [Solirubrobacteraceae bacterium]|nr:WxL domain-containing protein [Patulibacter sp.]